MNLVKVLYVDGQTIISAKNLNDIQDAIIELQKSSSQPGLNQNATSVYVCSDGEYTPGGAPTIEQPDESTYYWVPQDNEGTRYASWVYIDGAWQFVEMLTVTLEETEGSEVEEVKPATAKPVFFISATSYADCFLRYYDNQDKVATLQEVVDAYFAGCAYVMYPRGGNGRYSADRIYSVSPPYDDGDCFVWTTSSQAQIAGTSASDYEAVMAKYLS